MINSLAGVTEGTWLVQTKHSEYVFDLDDMTAKRIAGKDANKWHDEDVTYYLIGDVDVVLGESMHLHVNHEDYYVHSTPVKSISRVWDA